MEAPWPHSGLWGLILLPPTLLLVAICAWCRRPHDHGAPPDQDKPRLPGTFVLLAPQRCPPPQLPQWRPPPETIPSPLPPPPRAPPPAEERDDDYTNETYVTGYVDVIPDEESNRAAPPGGDYENVPDGARSPFDGSLEYINLPTGPAPRDASESEDNGGDYENA